MFVGSEGKPTRRHGVPWSDPPIATASTSPYVLAVLPRHIEVSAHAEPGVAHAGADGAAAGGWPHWPTPLRICWSGRWDTSW